MRTQALAIPLLISTHAYAKAADGRSELESFFAQNAGAIIITGAVIGIVLIINHMLDGVYRRIDARMGALEARQVQHKKEVTDAVIAQLKILVASNEAYRRQLSELITQKTATELEKALSKNELSQKVNDLFHEIKSVSINQEVFQDNIVRLCEYLKTKEEGVFKEVEETNARLKRRLGKVS